MVAFVAPSPSRRRFLALGALSALYGCDRMGIGGPGYTFAQDGLPPALDAHLRRLFASDGVPGVMIAVTQDGALLAHGLGGRAGPNPRLRVHADTLFDFGALAWRLAAIAALRLVQDGGLDLDLPQGEGAPTLRQQLHWQIPENAAQRAHWAPPGAAEWAALQAVLAQASGQGIADLLQSALSAAALPRARLDTPGLAIPNRAIGLVKSGDDWVPARAVGPPGLLLSLNDAVGWAAISARLLAPQTAVLLDQPMPLSPGRTAPFACGAHIDRFAKAPLQWLVHDGSNGCAVWLSSGGIDVLASANGRGVGALITQLAFEALDGFAAAPTLLAAAAVADRRPDLTARVAASLRGAGEAISAADFSLVRPRARHEFILCELLEHEETRERVSRWHRLVGATGERSIVRAIFTRDGALEWLAVI